MVKFLITENCHLYRDNDYIQRPSSGAGALGFFFYHFIEIRALPICYLCNIHINSYYDNFSYHNMLNIQHSTSIFQLLVHTYLLLYTSDMKKTWARKRTHIYI